MTNFRSNFRHQFIRFEEQVLWYFFSFSWFWDRNCWQHIYSSGFSTCVDACGVTIPRTAIVSHNWFQAKVITALTSNLSKSAKLLTRIRGSFSCSETKLLRDSTERWPLQSKDVCSIVFDTCECDTFKQMNKKQSQFLHVRCSCQSRQGDIPVFAFHKFPISEYFESGVFIHMVCCCNGIWKCKSTKINVFESFGKCFLSFFFTATLQSKRKPILHQRCVGQTGVFFQWTFALIFTLFFPLS